MSTLTEGKYTGEFLISEGNGAISRAIVTVLSGEDLVAGTVLGKVTASGKYVQLAPAATDGSKAAAGILYGATDASGGDTEGVAILRLAEVHADEITWPDEITEGETATATAELAALNIYIRS